MPLRMKLSQNRGNCSKMLREAKQTAYHSTNLWLGTGCLVHYKHMQIVWAEAVYHWLACFLTEPKNESDSGEIVKMTLRNTHTQSGWKYIHVLPGCSAMGVTGWDWVIIVTYPVDVVPFTSRSANEPVHNILLKLSSANRHQDINSCEILTVHKCGESLFHRDVAIIRGLIIQYLVAQLVYCR